MKTKIGVILLSSILLIGVNGCGDKIKLGGRVLFSDDMTPLTSGVVCFETDSYLAKGVIQPDGRYRLGSLSRRDGIRPGTYRVYVSGAFREIGMGADGMPVSESLIDRKFGDPRTSGLVCPVNSATKNFDFRVDRFRAE